MQTLTFTSYRVRPISTLHFAPLLQSASSKGHVKVNTEISLELLCYHDVCFKWLGFILSLSGQVGNVGFFYRAL